MWIRRRSFRPSLRLWRLFLLAVAWLLIAVGDELCQARTIPASTQLKSNSETITATATASSPNNSDPNGHLRLFYTNSGRVQIPGLYDELDGDITPIRGQAQFNKLIFGLDRDEETPAKAAELTANSSALCQSNSTSGEKTAAAAAAIRRIALSEQISLVQFYMASCPDCQGFSPYFKRFSRDISRRWRQMVKIYTVNCNDFLNIHLCQEQNPRLIVPMVRWYVFPAIQRDHLKARASSSLNRTETSHESQFNYPEELLNIAHRQFIPKQRRDLISLRRATIRFIELTLDELSNDSQRIVSRYSGSRLIATPKSSRRSFYESLPVAWHQLIRLGSNQPDELNDDEQFLQDLGVRLARCREALRLESAGCSNKTSVGSDEQLRNFVVFENRTSFIGRTLIADWSSSMCSMRAGLDEGASNQTRVPFLLHRSIDFGLLKRANISGQLAGRSGPYLLAFNVAPSSEPSVHSVEELKLELMAWNSTEGALLTRHRRGAAPRARPERVQQRALLQEYYSRPKMIHPVRYAAAMSSIGEQNRQGKTIHKRDLGLGPSSIKQADLENANWVPEFVHAGEERLRRLFNNRLAHDLNEQVTFVRDDQPSEWGEIPRLSNNKTSAIAATEDDLSLMFLTDYYRALDEIVHVDLLSKGSVDGYQLLASCCFLRDIGRHFPFQGNALGSQEIGSKSVARHYVLLLQSAWLDRLRSQIGASLGNSTLDLHRDGCNRLAELAKSTNNSTSLSPEIHLDRVRVSSKELEQLQQKVERTNQLGLPPERHLKWKYCAGSAAYLRGHTCSLWILFHTLTVQDYLKSNGSSQLASADPEPREYKFQVHYARQPKRACDQLNPDGAYLASNTSELFIGETKLVLANIINFVRFYLPCTNCAAHFSCMVEHSWGLTFDHHQATPELHLLWLWEAHNRVNERTRGTHSEDPLRPKHIFPSFGACPLCYMRAPKSDETFDSMSFNQPQLVKFLVARYRRSAILNNQINIEELYRKP